MKIASLDEVGRDLGTYVKESESRGPVVITRDGKPVAVIVTPTDDDDLERLLLARSPRFRDLLDRSRKSIQDGRGLPSKEFWKAVDARYGKSSTTKRKPRKS